MNERLKHMGRLREKEIAAKALALRLKGDLAGVRDLLDPYKPLEDVDFQAAAAQAVEAATKSIEYAGLLAEIETLKKDLGV